LETETPVTKALVHGLIEGNDYQFRVIAVNKAGQSEPGEASKTFTAKPRFCKYLYISIFPVQIFDVEVTFSRKIQKDRNHNN